MSMYPQEIGPIPAETMRVARAAYPKGSLAMRLRDELGGIYRDEQFVGLFASRGQPAEAPWRLAMVLVLQYVEGLTDRQAAEAVRGRIDWKYALGLELTDPGIDASVRIASFAHEWWLGEQKRDYWMRCWIGVNSAAGSKQGANSAPIRPMCWPGCARCRIWNVWAKPCEPCWLTWRG